MDIETLCRETALHLFGDLRSETAIQAGIRQVRPTVEFVAARVRAEAKAELDRERKRLLELGNEHYLNWRAAERALAGLYDDLIRDTDERLALRLRLDDPGPEWERWGLQARRQWLVNMAEAAGRPVAEKNSFLPDKPTDGLHSFQGPTDLGGNNRCKFCGAYQGSVEAESPCEGEFRQSGKMRAWAADRWESLAGSVPVATPQPDSRLALLGPARIVLDRCAARENPDDPDGTEAGRMAQRIVDVIGHPVTDQAVVTPADRQRFDSCDETCTVDCGHSRVGMCLVYQVTDRFRWCGLPRGHEDDHDFTYPAAGPVATPTEPRAETPEELVAAHAAQGCVACQRKLASATPVPAVQPETYDCRDDHGDARTRVPHTHAKRPAEQPEER